MVGRVGSHQQPPCWLRDAPHRPWGSSRAPTRCLCGTRRGSSSAPPVGSCSHPAVGGQPHASPSRKHPSPCRDPPHPGRGLNPDALPGGAGTRMMLLENSPWSWQGYFWTHSEEWERSQEQHWALLQVPQTALWASCSSLSIVPLAKLLGWKAAPLPACWRVGHKTV